MIGVVTSCNKRYRIQNKSIIRLSQTICELLRLENCELCVSFVSEKEIASLNKQFRKKNKATDVLSFPQTAWEKPVKVSKAKKKPLAKDDLYVLGDVVISPDQALKNAENIGHSLDREVCFLLIHGILHLCGHDHIKADEERVMLLQQKKILKFLETSEPGPMWKNCAKLLGTK